MSTTSLVYEILEHLNSKGSTNFKKEELIKYSDNTTLKRFFLMALDKSVNYYQKKIPSYSKKHTGNVSLEEAMDSLNKLSKRLVTGKNAKIFLSKLLTECSKEDANVIQRIIKRDPMCKVSVATANKAWPGLIKIWPCMLCEKSTRKNMDNISYPAIIQEKSDGLRTDIMYVDGKVGFRSRNGKFIQMHGVFDSEIKKLSKYVPYDNFVIDCEGLIVKRAHINTPSSEWNNIPEEDLFEPRTAGNGIFNKCIQNTVEPEDVKFIRFKAWDIIPYESFMAGHDKTPYKTRLTIIKRVIELSRISVIGISKTAVVKDEIQALKFYKSMISIGKEGAILKNMESHWESKRSKNQVKLKIVKDLDMRIVAWYPHKKKKNWIGGFTVESEYGMVRVNVGSGLKDKDRKQDPIHFMKQIAHIQSNGLIRDKNAKDDDPWSLFLPIFKGVRLDKDEADTLEQIQEEFNTIS